jgi:4-aminobutyrate aminotransferase-like enzyme
MLGFDLPDTKLRDAFWKGCYAHGLLVIRSGERSIRLRPVLDLEDGLITEALHLMDNACCKLAS